MKTPSKTIRPRGFALVVTLSLMILLTVIAVGLLTLSSVALRSSGRAQDMTTARGNARLALMLAIGELQSSLGPDQRVSSSSAVLDGNPKTAAIDGVAHPHLLGVWQSWGGWLNGEAAGPDGAALSIRDTYKPGRAPMFRRWLLSLPETEAASLAFAKTGKLDAASSILLAGPGTVTETADQVRARRIPVRAQGRETGACAWWVGGENQKADATANRAPAAAEPGLAEASSGDFGSRALDAVENFDKLPDDGSLTTKLVNYRQLHLASVSEKALRDSFHDVAVGASGVLADVRWGGLKKDLNLLFENGASLPTALARNSRVAPGPRPMSPDLLAFNPKMANRQFSSFEMMRDFYRLYKSGGVRPLKWTGKEPLTQEYIGRSQDGYGNPDESGFRRTPVIARFYSIYSLRSTLITARNQPQEGGKVGNYNHDLVHTTVVSLWNPYNTRIEIPSGSYKFFTLPYKILPTQYRGFQNGAPLNASWIDLQQGGGIYNYGGDTASAVVSDDGRAITFQPGQFLIFSKRGTSYVGDNPSSDTDLHPGYDPYADNSRRLRVYSNKPNDGTRWGISLRLQPLWKADGTSWWWGGNPGAFNVLNQTKTSGSAERTQGFTYDWTAADFDNAPLAPEGGPDMVDFQPGVSEPIPFATTGVSLKTASLPDYLGSVPDYRSKNWIQGLNSLPFVKMNVSYNDAALKEFQRLDSPFFFHFRSLSGTADLAELFSRDKTNTITHLGAGVDGEKIYSAATQELPSAPVTSLAGFAGMPLRPGWYAMPPALTAGADGKGEIPKSALSRAYDNVAAYNAGVPGVGIGNSFAQPSIPGDKVYAYRDVSKNAPQSADRDSGSGVAVTDSLALSDYWDHALLVNDGLWDSWFTSSLADTTRPTDPKAETVAERLTNFFKNNESLPDRNYMPWTNGAPEDAISALKGADGYLEAAANMLNGTAFNVNSTSVAAWHALFLGLRERPATYRDKSGALKIIEAPEGRVVLSRFITANGDGEVGDPRSGVDNGNGPAWTGVRFLNDSQLLALAGQCVIQVKLRGPFLNMSDFVNRRLAVDATGVSGMLQSAIDYDDAKPDADSINHEYKSPADMIGANGAYAFPPASAGSRFTGAPGYVVQSDLLRPLGNSLTVRDDTYIVRAYGEAKSPNGLVTARAWCEARIQRVPDYVDPSVRPETPATKIGADGKAADNSKELKTVNARFGRQMRVVSFRWLNPQEI